MKVALLLLALALVGKAGNAAPAPAAPANPKVALETTKGKIVIELFAAKAPKSVENFLAYVKEGFYDGTIFHRVIPSFMIQGGGFDSQMTQKPTHAPIPNEAGNGLTNQRGTLAMARTMEPNSASSQFFINTVDNQFLNHKDNTPQGYGYAVFAKVVSGMDVVDAISKVATGRKGPYENVPNDPVVIQKATLLP